MFFPLGAVGERVRPPVLTLVIIAINVIVHVATLERAWSDERRLARPAGELYALEAMIELKHRGASGTVASWMGLRSESMGRRSFWWRWERGFVVPKTDDDWIAWNEANHAFREVHRTTLHYRYGFRRDEPKLVGLATHGFLHGGFAHLFFNMLFLWAVGATVEDAWGRRWFALLYVFGLMVSAAADFVFVKPGLDIPGIGASGAIAAVMGAMAVRHFRKPMRVASMIPFPGVYRVATGWLLVPWIVGELVSSARSDAMEQGVGFGAHIGGFAAGAVFALALRLGKVEGTQLQPRYEAEVRAKRRDAHVEMAESRLKRGETAPAIDEFLLALEADPDDVELRTRLVELLGMVGRLDEQRTHALELMQRLWRAGQRERYAQTWEWLEGRVALPPAIAHRVAPLQEARDPIRAARTYTVALQQAPDDPLASQSYRKYAELLDRLNEPGKAATVRQLAAAHERRKRDATLR